MSKQTHIIIKELLKEFKYTQSDLAKKLNVTQASISRYLSGQMQIDIDTLKEIANIFNVSTDYLLGRSEIKTSEETTNINAFHSISTDGLSKEEIDLVKAMVEQLKKKK
ncbi:helix-turn-helix domain-containing protein [Helicovermis profundi]|uniref:HTH cro/C1-type domain-containing protein n=1 Tax=Helicovermis profundi TaxID=3065157 RepID=A0AAU9E2F5_9FIRM|nr:hypothetical protein HLPR_11170 [Clostridia bacterium S502]